MILMLSYKSDQVVYKNVFTQWYLLSAYYVSDTLDIKNILVAVNRQKKKSVHMELNL